MKAAIYKKFLDEKLNLIFSTVILLILFHVGVESMISSSIWIAFIGNTFSKDELSFFRTLNFSKKQFFQANIVFSILKLIMRLLLVFVFSLIFPKTQAHIIYFLGFLYTFFLIEIAQSMYSSQFSGREGNETKDIFISIMGFLIVAGSYIWFLTRFFWPMERLVYGTLLLSAIVIVFSIYKFYTYKGVHYVEDKRIRL